MKLIRTFIIAILLFYTQVLFTQERYRKFPPSPEPLKMLRLPTLESAVLSNGLEITVAKREKVVLMTIQLVILAGESSSPEKLPGLATFTANMITKGTATLSSADIEEKIESIGGKLSVSTYLNYSLFTFSFLDEYFDEALDILSKIILEPRFSKREIDILVSTSVVEVGIDIPNASVIVIEGAERFGLAQLHQFRGRVGRGDHQSYCFLFTDSASVKTQKRLKALLKSSNGFELAEKDLEIRGPGELAGIRQSGLPDLAMSSLSDTELVKNAREEAKNILKNSSNLSKYPKLLKKLDKFTEKVHFE